MSKSPFFSIAIPTTRLHYLPSAVRSVLNQSFKDFELLISLNYPSDTKISLDDDIYSDPRVRFIRTSEYLTVSKHWNFIYQNTKGNWHLLLGDDDALLPDALRIIHDALMRNLSTEALRWKHCAYQLDGNNKGMLDYNLANYSGNEDTIDSHELIDKIYKTGTITGPLKSIMPNFPMAVFSNQLINKIKSITNGNFFFIEPMTSSGMLVLSQINNHLVIDLPLTILGSSSDSAGGSVNVETLEESTFRLMNSDVLLKNVSSKLVKVFPAWKTEVLLELNNRYPEIFSKNKLNWSGYFIHTYRVIKNMRLNGYAVSNEIDGLISDFNKQNIMQKLIIAIKFLMIMTKDNIILYLKSKNFIKENYDFIVGNKSTKEMIYYSSIINASVETNNKINQIILNKK